MARLRSTEDKLAKNPDLAAAYKDEMHKLETSGYAVKLVNKQREQWKHGIYHTILYSTITRTVWYLIAHSTTKDSV